MKRAISLALAAMLLTSCGGGSATSESTTTAASGETTTVAAETTDYLETIPKVDFGGEDFRMLVHSASDRPNIHAGEINGEVVNDAMVERDNKVAEMFNLNFVYTVNGDRVKTRDEIRRLVQAGEDAYEVVMPAFIDGAGMLASEELLYDLGSLDGLDLTNEWWSQSANNAMQFGDKIYATSGPMSLCYCYSPYAFFVNLDMAEDFGLGSFYDLVSSGRWTIDAMSESMKNIYSDLNNSAAPDVGDRFAMSVTEAAGLAFYIGAGQQMIEKTKTSAEILIDSEASMNALDKLNSTLRVESVINTEKLATVQDTSMKTKIFIDSQALFCAAPIQWGSLNFRDMNDDYAILPFPKYDESQDEYYSYANTYFPIAVAIPITSAKAEQTASVMEALAYLGETSVRTKINEVVLKEKIARDEQSAQMIDLLYKNMIVDFNAIFNFGATINPLRKYAIGETENFASTYAGLKAATETKLAETMELLK